jgi:serine/threonine protein phosphatase PrpC
MASVGAVTHAGQIRELNEDSIGTPELMQVPANLQAERGRLLAVADGMGGHAAGEVASQLALQILYEKYYNDPSPELDGSLERAVEQANARIHRQASSDLSKHGMGTTLVAAIIQGNRLIVANVGDSRAYLIRKGKIRQISQDHSWVTESLAAGLITEEQAKHHPHRNLVMRALGQKPDVKVDLFHDALRPGDTVVLCSDGLSNEAGDGEIADIASQRPAQDAAKALVALANQRQGRDNISVVVAKMPPQHRPVVMLPIAILSAVILVAFALVALLQLGLWGGPSPVDEEDASVAAVTGQTSLSATASLTVTTLPTEVPTQSPAVQPTAGQMATPPIAVPAATPTPVRQAMPTQEPSPLATPTPPGSPTAGSSPADSLIELRLGWGCNASPECKTNANALAGLCQLLHLDPGCCHGQDLDPEGVLRRESFVRCPLPDPLLVCWQGVVGQFMMRGDGEVLLKQKTDSHDPLTVSLIWDPERPLQRPPPHWLLPGSQLMVCGISTRAARLHARFIVHRPGEASPVLWHPASEVDEKLWLAGRAQDLLDLLPELKDLVGSLSEAPSGLGKPWVLVYSHLGADGHGDRIKLEWDPLNEDDHAIFRCSEPGEGCVHISERGE